ncbi:MAG: acetylglutamate kinase [Clostridiaceae bacterium]|jgi:acetylglutamate kinase|nr:acetylglutamate kinase [Clostridiaceae bacterium]
MNKNISNADKAEVLIQALPYIQKYHDKIIVIKYGGNAMVNEDLKKAVMTDIVLLHQIGIKVVLVHGGGLEINQTLEKMQIPTRFVNGLRQTDKEAVNVVQMVLAGKVNKDLVNLLENSGGNAMGICGIDGHLLEAKSLSEELGFVGEIISVNVKPVLDLLEKNYIPVISTIGYDRESNVYNINADTAAAKIAAALKADSLITLTDIKGILRDKHDDNTLIPTITAAEAPKLIKKGVIEGGMIPKVECCVDAVNSGVKRVFIIDGRVPHSILIEVLSDQGIGTMFLA